MDTKKEVLTALEQNIGKPVSGTKLAEKIGVSRTAVWKAIASLREEGYQITSRTNSGYMLDVKSDILSEAAITGKLKHPVPVHVFDTLETTNKTAAEMAMDGAVHGTTVIARCQTKGRGRRGRSFYSPQDTGLYLSIVLEPSNDLSKSVLITSAVAVAVATAIEEVSGKETQIKWVNDIYWDGKKVVGTLTEAITDFETGQINHIVTGIGVNCSTEYFPESAGQAGSLGGGFSRNDLAAAIIDHVLDQVENIEQRRFIKEYRRRSMVIGQKIDVYPTIGGEPYPAMAIDIDEDGGLIIETPGGTTKTLSTGEITIRVK